MSTWTWRMLALVFLAVALVLVVAAIVLYRVLHIRQVRDALTGRSAATEIEQMRTARAGTWAMAGSQLQTGDLSFNPGIGNSQDFASSREHPVEFVVHSADTSSESGQVSAQSSRVDDDEQQTSLIGHEHAETSARDDEAQTTLAERF
ncbi:hypothetical protein [Bifidobacterium mellis]|uniref:Uncharacterized protein n=1 Tax=Bifidobacterium mellis TaxID=1293823 RepID=A0A0F4L097_9BIFI|nr:hypothetical protein [Bifidobacterium mellis]KJY52307.1 hypothetical protein JF70_03990 [Bifidobacterium mellis]